MSHYDYTETETAVGLAVRFNGPGMSRYQTIHPRSTHEADTMARMLSAAFEAGRHKRAEEIREALGIHNGPWGIKIESPQ